MVGIVVVSHSARIAEGVRELAAQVVPAATGIVCAGGMEDGSIGTDAVRVCEAIREADGGSGVVLLADLGSAVMSAEMAIELLGDDGASGAIDARIADAPLVEGAIAAAVEAGCGGAIDDVVRAAEEARGARKLG
ncbi:MAG: PTS-dependent dihydroxyacetone kinase phosphotransferase subunit DhaM [Olsenella sp.]|nr:PTS-dependent dihydroxyacetone kinase phosphotransferase subunit DhaM [Olsenella sp.]